MLTRRNLAVLPLLAMPAVARGAGDWPRIVVDAVGRQVTLSRPAVRVVLAESMLLYSLMMIHPDPASLLVGMGGDLRRGDPGGMASLTRRFPGFAEIPELTQQVGQDLPLERLLSLRPDLVVMGAWQHARPDTAQLLGALAASGIPVVFVDLFLQPMAQVVPTLRILGEVLDRREAASAYAAFHQEEYARVRSAVAGRPRPRAMLQVLPGLRSCCWVTGQGGLGETLSALGGRNVAEPFLPDRRGGDLSAEQVVVLDPDVYIGTGMAQDGGIRLGFGVDAALARRSLAEAVKAPELAVLPAVGRGRVFGIWNYFNGALNVLALRAMAGWLYPELARQLDPAGTLETINRRFAAMPVEGAFWTSL